jgi:CHAT domain-containing protein
MLILRKEGAQFDGGYEMRMCSHQKNIRGGFMSSTALFRAATVIAVAALSACQSSGTKTVSVEEAKQITATFAPATFKTPSRSSSDILDVLAREKSANPTILNALIARADGKIPSGGTDLETADHYFERAYAAKVLGRIEASSSDYLKAAEYARKVGDGPLEARFLGWLANNQLFFGDFAEGLKNKFAAVEVSRGGKRRGRLLINLAMLSRFAAKAGKLELADNLLLEAQDIFSQIGDHTNTPPQDRAFMAAGLRFGASAGALARGQLRKAEKLAREAVNIYAPFKDQEFDALTDTKEGTSKRYYYFLVQALADVLNSEGRLVEAEAKAREGLLGTFEYSPYYSSDVAWNIRALAKIIAARGRAEEAEALSEEAVKILQKNGVPFSSMIMVDLTNTTAAANASLEQWDDVAAAYDRLKAALEPDGQLARTYLSESAMYTEALVLNGRASEAEQQLRPQLVRLETELGADSYRTARLQGMIGATLVAQDRKDEALAIFAGSIPVFVEQVRKFPANAGSAARTRERRFIIGSYIKLLSQIQGTSLEGSSGLNAADEAFKLADMIRNENVRRSLDASSARAAARDPRLADLARREQDAQRGVAALSEILNGLTNQKTGDRDKATEAALVKRIDDLNASRKALSQEISNQFPDYADLINPKLVGIENVRSTLQPGEAMLSFLVQNDMTYIWAVPKSGPALFKATALGADALDDIVSDLRLALAPTAIASLGDIPPFDVAKAHNLYQKLISPVEAALASTSSLIVVPDGPLGHLPLAVLPTKSVQLAAEGTLLFANHQSVPWLIKSYEITNTPSVSSYQSLRSNPPSTENRRAFLGIGDPLFSQSQALEQAAAETASTGTTTRGLPVTLRSVPKLRGVDSATLALLPRLPDTANELYGIAGALGADPARDIHIGKNASEARVKSMDLAGSKVLVFATHGLVAGDLDGLDQPALALSSPDVVGGNDDGLLTMGEILGLKLNADWAVLSACNTGAGDGKGAEAVSGLGSAFFYAGARALLVSNWPVHSGATAVLTQDLFQRQVKSSGLSRAAALKGTLSYMIDEGAFKDEQGRKVYSYSHPLFWAPFTLVGDGGGENTTYAQRAPKPAKKNLPVAEEKTEEPIETARVISNGKLPSNIGPAAGPGGKPNFDGRWVGKFNCTASRSSGPRAFSLTTLIKGENVQVFGLMRSRDESRPGKIALESGFTTDVGDFEASGTEPSSRGEYGWSVNGQFDQDKFNIKGNLASRNCEGTLEYRKPKVQAGS